MEIENQLNQIIQHIQSKRYKKALTCAIELFDAKPSDYRTSMLLGWAYLENDYPKQALEYADYSVKLCNTTSEALLYRAFFLIRMAIYKGALDDLEKILNPDISSALNIDSPPLSKQSDNSSITYLLGRAFQLKAQALAGMGNFFSALENFEESLNHLEIIEPRHKLILELYKAASEINSDFIKLAEYYSSDFDRISKNLEEAFNEGEFWFVIQISDIILHQSKNIINDSGGTSIIDHQFFSKALFYHLQGLISTFQVKKALSLIEENKIIILDNFDFFPILDRIKIHHNQEGFKKNGASSDEFSEKKTSDSKIINTTDFSVEDKNIVNSDFTNPDNSDLSLPESDLSIFPWQDGKDILKNDLSLIQLFSAKVFDYIEELNLGERNYYYQFEEGKINFIGLEVIAVNPYFKVKNHSLQGNIKWFFGNLLLGNNNFELDIKSEWEYFLFVQTYGSESPDFWNKGRHKIEITLADELIATKSFYVDDCKIIQDNSESSESDISQKASINEVASTTQQILQNELSLEELLKELDSYTGLEKVKSTMRDFVDYLTFIKEREKSGLITKDSISLHTVFTGNPGTGKTTIARLISKIFFAMGLLSKGHLIEVDRAAIVGQYIGETAPKTEKAVNDAVGGVLFIDEAYTLFKQGNSQDFGKEAIDIILKRMEDMAGQFAVIVAGYSEEMKGFIESNPGLKSRFNFTFEFDDYSPDELILILKKLADKEEYVFSDDSIELIKKHLTTLYRKRDKSFGNARLVKSVFSEAKMRLGKRYLKLPPEQKTKEALSIITVDEILPIFNDNLAKNIKLTIDEENLKTLLSNLDSLTGLTVVKDEIKNIVKLAKYYYEQGDDLSKKFTDHIVFSGNPGTGKTTVARLFSEILSALTILPKGHLVEADRQKFVASFSGGTAEKTHALINKSLGGTLFIDEAYTLSGSSQSSSDFGKEAIDTLLKRMEDDRGKFIVIAAGYTENMKQFIDSNPGLQSRFTKYIHFDDYSPDELMNITEVSIKEKSLVLSEEAKKLLKKHYMELYRTRDKNFGNARLVRNIVDSFARVHLLRLVDLPQEQRNSEENKIIIPEDLKNIIDIKPEKKSVKISGNQELLDKYLLELDELSGLDSVKSSVQKLIQSIKVSKMREERGLKVIPKSLHSVFFGNPGTGKTTVARLISKIYKEMGLLEKGHLVEVDRTAMVASHVGQTALKTEDVINSALGGTLFIDEAYNLSKGANDFGQEAIDTLLKRMEDFKEQFVVIVAGYTNEMKRFLESNPGLKSRFTNYFYFEDYTPRQMLEIVSYMSEKNGYKPDEGAFQLLWETFQEIYDHRDQNFGNARTVRNILLKAISNQEERILTINNPTDDDLITICFEDVQRIDFKSEL